MSESNGCEFLDPCDEWDWQLVDLRPRPMPILPDAPAWRPYDPSSERNVMPTEKTITESQIRQLRSEAARRDAAQVIVCDVALGEAIDLDDYAIDAHERVACERAAEMTQEQAAAECARVIAQAQAQATAR